MSSVGTVLAFSVFFGFWVLEDFVRVLGRAFGPHFVSKRAVQLPTMRYGFLLARDGGMTILMLVIIVKLIMSLVMCCMMRMRIIMRLVTIMKWGKRMSFNTLVKWKTMLRCV